MQQSFDQGRRVPRSRSDIPPATELTPREREVAALIAEGLSNAEIADCLLITPGTVANHLTHITRALGVRNRVQLAVWSVEQGLRRPGADSP